MTSKRSRAPTRSASGGESRTAWSGACSVGLASGA